MNSKRLTEILVTIFLGYLGVHKFMKGETAMGVLYLCTFGLFGIGWIIDIVKVLNGTSDYKVKGASMMSKQDRIAIQQGAVVNIQDSGLNLQPGEFCCYMDHATTTEESTEIAGYVHNNTGWNVKISDGLSYNIGKGDSQAVRQTRVTTYDGLLCLTNRRVIYASDNFCIDRPFSQITAIGETPDGIVMQAAERLCRIKTNTHLEFKLTYDRVKNGDYDEEA